ncbi:MAG: sarcosine oxidase subunit delta family protein [Rhizobiales bacterium]|nr:sarcosine oxidase subunit delta family protein [Hyphomicrobiales bacterium]
MLVIECPHCGPREQEEFSYGGEAHIARPTNSADLSDAEWAEYVFMRSNTKGVFAERWMHAAGCRKWFNVIRNTATDRILAVYAQGAPRPVVDLAGEALRTPSGEPFVGSGNDATKVLSSAESMAGKARSS